MSMKLELAPEQTFSARAGDHIVHGLRISSEWEGLRKLVDAKGRHLILDGESVVRGTDSLLHDLRLTTLTDGFITVPARTLPTGQHVPEFQVGKYVCSKSKDGLAFVSADGKPWVNINFAGAKTACEVAGFSLITELQYLSIACDIAEQDINWTGGKVGQGKLFQGLHLGTVKGAQDGHYVSPNESERRWHQLSNGERIYDFSGNVWTWVFDDVHGNGEGIISSTITADSPSLACAPDECHKQGGGYLPDAPLNWSRVALIRGGCWCSGDDAGVFLLGYGWPDYGYVYLGFRCTK